MSFKPHNILITGGAGFIGANFVHHWLRTTATGQVIVLDALTYAGNRASLAAVEADPRFAFIQGDICDEDAVRTIFKQREVDTLVHFAAESHVDRSIVGPDEFVRTNVVGTHTLLKVAKAVWMNGGAATPHRFHHVSTDEVYGSLAPEDPPFTEATAYAPNSPYSASKAGSDHLVRAYHETFGLCTTVTNCSNNYGPYQFPEKLIPLIILNILAGKALPVYGDGHQVRDWLHVEDHCIAISLALTRGIPGAVYNVGGNSETRNIDVVRTLCRVIDDRFAEHPQLSAAYASCPGAAGQRSESLIEHIRDRPGHDRRYAIDFSKANRDLGYAPARDLLQGLTATVDWFFANAHWWRPLLGERYASWIASNYST